MFEHLLEIVLKILGCQQSSYDPAPFFKRKGRQLIRMVACHVDDFLHSGNTEFDKDVMIKLRERYLDGKLEQGVSNILDFKLVKMMIVEFY